MAAASQPPIDSAEAQIYRPRIQRKTPYALARAQFAAAAIHRRLQPPFGFEPMPTKVPTKMAVKKENKQKYGARLRPKGDVVVCLKKFAPQRPAKSKVKKTPVDASTKAIACKFPVSRSPPWRVSAATIAEDWAHWRRCALRSEDFHRNMELLQIAAFGQVLRSPPSTWLPPLPLTALGAWTMASTTSVSSVSPLFAASSCELESSAEPVKKQKKGITSVESLKRNRIVALGTDETVAAVSMDRDTEVHTKAKRRKIVAKKKTKTVDAEIGSFKCRFCGESEELFPDDTERTLECDICFGEIPSPKRFVWCRTCDVVFCRRCVDANQ